jgi:hypothetical protein
MNGLVARPLLARWHGRGTMRRPDFRLPDIETYVNLYRLTPRLVRFDGLPPLLCGNAPAPRP